MSREIMRENLDQKSSQKLPAQHVPPLATCLIGISYKKIKKQIKQLGPLIKNK